MKKGMKTIMSLIPLFKNLSKDDFTTEFDLKLRHGHPVLISIPSADLAHIDDTLTQNGEYISQNDTFRFAVTQFRADRYDGPDRHTTLSAWVYLDETTNQVIAINDSVRNIYQRSERYDFEQTPFQEIVLFGKTDA